MKIRISNEIYGRCSKASIIILDKGYFTAKIYTLIITGTFFCYHFGNKKNVPNLTILLLSLFALVIVKYNWYTDALYNSEYLP